MNNFQSVDGKTLFSPAKLIAAWEQLLFKTQGKGPGNTTSNKNSNTPAIIADAQVLQRLTSKVQQMWRYFNEDRAGLDKHYMEDATLLEAYTAAFFLPNVQRTFTILTAPEVFKHLTSLASRETFAIADFGSGPLSASFGALAALEVIQGSAKRIVPLAVQIEAIERSQKAVALGEQLLKSSRAERSQIEVRRSPSSDKIEASLDLAICANALNEIPVRHRLATLSSLFDKLRTGGLLVVLEPGQDVHSKQLGVVRDDFLEFAKEKGDAVSIIAPCPHIKACPLSARTDRKDWCWFQNAWEVPSMLSQLDTKTKLEHHELNFSFVVFRKGPVAIKQAPFARVVSSPIVISALQKPAFDKTRAFAGRNTVDGNPQPINEAFSGPHGVEKSILCTRDGQLEGDYRALQKPAPLLPDDRRGTLILKPEDCGARVRERVSWASDEDHEKGESDSFYDDLKKGSTPAPVESVAPTTAPTTAPSRVPTAKISKIVPREGTTKVSKIVPREDKPKVSKIVPREDKPKVSKIVPREDKSKGSKQAKAARPKGLIKKKT